VVVIDHLVDEREVYVCFKRTPEGLKLRAQFDAALKRVNPARMASDYMKAYVSKQR
jgi:hypothetical protein